MGKPRRNKENPSYQYIRKGMTYLQLMNKVIIALLYTFDNLDEIDKALRKQNFLNIT